MAPVADIQTEELLNRADRAIAHARHLCAERALLRTGFAGRLLQAEESLDPRKKPRSSSLTVRPT